MRGRIYDVAALMPVQRNRDEAALSYLDTEMEFYRYPTTRLEGVIMETPNPMPLPGSGRWTPCLLTRITSKGSRRDNVPPPTALSQAEEVTLQRLHALRLRIARLSYIPTISLTASSDRLIEAFW